MSLTRRAFLEPGLDSLWHTLDSFEPLLACLPTDLWRIEEKKFGNQHRYDYQHRTPPSVYYLNRALVPSDVDRYLTQYAPRIRHIKGVIYDAKRIPSLELLQALQEVTGSQPGALAPHIRSFEWIPRNFVETLNPFGLEYSNNIQPFMPLFVGANLTKLAFNMEPCLPLQALTLLSTAKQPNFLENLDLGSDTAKFADDYLRASTWNHLKCLQITTLLPSTILYLANLPQLSMLSINSLKAKDWGISATERRSCRPIEGFSCLTELCIDADTVSTITGFLQHFPTLNKLETLEAFARARCSSEGEAQAAIDTITERLNSDSLMDLRICDSIGNRDVPDYAPQEDSEYRPPIKIAPFYIFKRLKFINVVFSHWISITPDDIAQIRTVWTEVEFLEIHENCPVDPSPLIDHTHLLYLLSGCPSLVTLALRFDATRVSGEETGGPYFKLTELNVGCSTISSPASVWKFIEANFPHLERLEAGSLGKDSEHLHNMNMARWKKVQDALDDRWDATWRRRRLLVEGHQYK